MRTRQDRAFTLIELLVVVGIIAMLMGILMPTISKAREAGKRTKCLANLSGIGKAIRGYMDEYNNYYPPMAFLPKDEPILYPTGPRLPMSDPNGPSVLGPYVSKQFEVFHCPSDRFVKPEKIKDCQVQPKADETTWFKWQGSSYEPRMALSTVSSTGYLKMTQEFRPDLTGLSDVDAKKAQTLFEDLTKLDLVYDYENFHDPDGNPTQSSRMALFADFHAAAKTGE